MTHEHSTHKTPEPSADVVLAKPCPLDELLLEVRRLVRRAAA
jgi:hypothetical protein